MYVARKYREESGQAHKEQFWEKEVPYQQQVSTEASSAAVGSQQTSPTPSPGITPPPLEKVPPQQTPSKGGKQRKLEPAAECESKAEEGDKEKFKKLRDMKAKAVAALAQSTEILMLIQSDDTWSWAKGSVLHKALEDSAQSFADMKKSSQWWSAWAIQDNFAKYVAKHFDGEITSAEMLRRGEVETMIGDVQKHACRLRSMHAACQAIA